MTSIRALILAAALAVSAPVLAHTDDWFDANPPASGGQIRMAGPYHFELMPAQPKDGVLINVTDHGDQKIATAGWSASALVLAGGKKSKIALKPAGENSLRGVGKLPAGSKVVVSIKDKDGKAYSARFTPAAAGKAAAKPGVVKPGVVKPGAATPPGHEHGHDHGHDHGHEHGHDHPH